MFDKVSLIMGILGLLFVQVFIRVNATLEAAMLVGPSVGPSRNIFEI